MVKPKLGMVVVEGANRASFCRETMSVIVRFLAGSSRSSRCLAREYEPCSGVKITGTGMARTAAGAARKQKNAKIRRQRPIIDLMSMNASSLCTTALLLTLCFGGPRGRIKNVVSINMKNDTKTIFLSSFISWLIGAAVPIPAGDGQAAGNQRLAKGNFISMPPFYSEGIFFRGHSEIRPQS